VSFEKEEINKESAMAMRDGGMKRDGTWKTTLNMESTKVTDPARKIRSDQ